MRTKIIQTGAGWYAVMVWDVARGDWSLWWSGSRNREDAEREEAALLSYKR